MAGDEGGKACVLLEIGGTEIGVNHRDPATEAFAGIGQGVAEVAAE